ncbi:MAG: cation:proton antiporter [Thermoplasmata archaeon]
MAVNTTLFIVDLFILFAAAVLVGELFTRFGQVALVGQLLVGIVVGPTLLGPQLGISANLTELNGIQFLATFFILVMAGLEVSPEQIYRTGRSATILGVAIFTVPFAVGAFLVALVIPGLGFLTALFVSLTLSITALPVMGVMLTEFKIGKTPLGVLLLNTAVVNELAAVTVFAALLRIQQGGTGLLNVSVAFLSTGLFLTTVLSAHMLLRLFRENRIWAGLKRRFQSTWKSREAGFALLMAMALGSALYSQYLGLTYLVGAFYAGLLITPESAGFRDYRSIHTIFDAMSWGFFIPLFFAFIGIQMDLRDLAATWELVVAFVILCVFAVFSKMIVGWLLSRLLGWEQPEALAIGFFVSSRGAVELAMALILLQEGVFTTVIFTLVAAVGLVTTVISPIGASHYGRFGPAGERRSSAAPWGGAYSAVGDEGSIAQADETPLV